MHALLALVLLQPITQLPQTPNRAVSTVARHIVEGSFGSAGLAWHSCWPLESPDLGHGRLMYCSACYSCPTSRARPDPARARSGPARSGLARLARITNHAGPSRPTCPGLCTSTSRGPVWRAGPARYARRASWAVPARARLGICTRPPLPQLRMISRFQI